MTNRPDTGRILIAAIALLALAAGAPAQAPHLRPNTLAPAEKAAGWTLLFDGVSTDHFRGYKQGAFPRQGWTVENGVLTVHAAGGGGDIITKEQYGDFEFSVEYKVTEGANSGIIYRLDERHSYPWQTGPEYQILDNAGYGVEPTDNHAAGALYDLYPPQAGAPNKPAGDWNTVVIRISDGHVTHILNGAVVVRADMNSDDWTSRIAGSKFAPYEGFGVLETGHIGLQDHGNEVAFRNIKIRDLGKPMPGGTTLFNGRNLEGLNTFYRGESEDEAFTAADGVLRCTGNPIGCIQTGGEYTNYVMSVEWRWPDEPGNSGVLLRKTGDDKVWPRSIEAQLLAGSAGDLLSIDGVPMTGAPDRTEGRVISRSHDAEYPPGEWNHYEIIVNQDAMTLFVNGEQVNHITGVPEEAGKVCLQSEGAPIEFRNWRLAPIE